MKKEDYLLTSLEQKSKEWLKNIRPYTKRGGITKEDLSSCALLVIDMQHFFLDTNSHAFVPSAPMILKNIKRLVRVFRDNRLPVIFTRYAVTQNENAGSMGTWWKDVVFEGSRHSKIIPAFRTLKSDFVIRKRTYDGFCGTSLESTLRKKKVKNVVITGVLTHLCCDTTAREAFVRNFGVYFVIDATATYNEELHLASLRTLSHGCVVPVRTTEIPHAFSVIP